jgi:hypothetical protein
MAFICLFVKTFNIEIRIFRNRLNPSTMKNNYSFNLRSLSEEGKTQNEKNLQLIRHSRQAVRNSEFATRNSMFATLNSKFSILHSKFSTLHSQFSTLNSQLLTLALFLALSIGNGWGQKSSSDKRSNNKFSNNKPIRIDNEGELWKKEPFGNYDMSMELLDKRDAYSKHFSNDQGSTTAHIASGPIHYQENGQWKTIYHSIEPSINGGFQNIHNSIKTYYPASSNGNIVTELPNGLVMRDMQNMRMYYEGNGQVLSAMNISSAAGKSDFNILTYSGVYGSDIDLRLTQHTSMRKMDYILNNANALISAPQEAEYLVFEEKITLPEGVIAVLENNIIILKTANGEILAQYERPEIRENASAKNNERKSEITEGLYSISQSGNELYIQTKVSIAWLKDANRVFPIEIDPTVNLYPDNISGWTGEIETYSATSFNYASNTINAEFTGYFSLGQYNSPAFTMSHGFSKFNTTAIPDNATITSVNLNTFVDYDFASRISLNHTPIVNDPVTATNANRLSDIYDGTVYNSVAYNATVNYSSTGWKTFTLGGSSNSDLQTKLVANWFAVGYRTTYVRWADDYIGIQGYANTNKPYITVNYTCPAIVDRTITVNGTAGPVSVNVGQTVTIASSGGNTSNWCYWISSNGGTTWDMLSAGNCNQASFTYTICTPGTYVFHVRNSDACGYCWDGGRTCGSYNAVTVNVNAEPGFGSNAWNVLCYGAGDANGGSNAWVSSQYKGFYTMSSLNFDTRTGQTNSNAQSWGDDGSPSSASGYQGCSIGVDNHSYIFKRQGFTCGTYQLNLPSHDDMAILLVDGIEVWRNYGCCATRTAVWTGYLGSTSTVELRVSEGGGGSHGALEFVSLPISATVTGTNPTTCGGNGSITISNVQNGYRSVFQSDFSSTPAGASLTGVAGISGGELTLTTAANDQLGSVVLTPSYRSNAFTANYSQYIGGGTGADGMSFTYGPISGAANGALGAGGENGWASGLVVSFDTYNGATNSQLNIYWNGSLLTSSVVNPVIAPAFRTASFVPVRILVNTSNQLTVDWNSVNLLSNYSLPAGYVSADKSAWNYGFSARTGGLNDAHKVSDVYISSIAYLEYSTDGTNWSNTNPISKAAGTYTVQARPVGVSCPNANIGIVTLTNPTTIDWANLQSPASGSICATGSFTVYGRVYKNGFTNVANSDANFTVQVGYNNSNTNPSGWTNWNNATFNSQYGNNDEYMYTFSGLSGGATYYYAFRYKYCSDGAWYYGGYNASGGGIWDGINNVSGILNVSSVPTTANAGADQTGSSTCELTQVTLAGNTPTVGSGAWSIQAGTGGSVTTPSSATSTFTGTAGSTYTLRWTTSNSPCTASTDDVVITLNSNPTTANAGADQTGSATCGLTQVTLAGNAPTVGSGAWSIQSGTGGSVTTPSSATSTFSGVAGSTYTLRWTISNSPCTASTDDVVITLNSNPTAANAGADQSGAVTCGKSTISLAASAPQGLESGIWDVISASGQAPGTGVVNSFSEYNSNFTGVPGASYTLRWTLTKGVCSSSDDVNIAFTQPTLPGFTPANGDLLWGGLTDNGWSTSSNWYQFNSSQVVNGVQTSAWERLTSDEPSGTSNVLIKQGDGICMHTTNAPSLGLSESVDNLNISSGATLNLSNGSMSVKGDIVNNGTINPGTGTLSFDASSGDQTISGSQAVTLNNMTLDKQAGDLIISTPTVVKGNLTMSRGNINNSSLLTVGESSTAPGSIIHTNGSVLGQLRRYFDAAATPGSGYYFPVGNATNTRGTTIDFTSSPGTNQYLTVQYKSGYAGGATPMYTGLPLTTGDGVLIQNFDNEGYWEINPTADNYGSSINSAPYTITLQMKNLTGVNDRTTVRIIKAAGSSTPQDHHSTWSALNFGANPVSGSTNTDFTVTGTSTGFSWFGAGSGNNNPLPVELVSFTGACDNGVISLTWQTASEFNSSHFDVEKSRDGENWQVLTTLPSAGTSNELITYQSTDQNGTQGNNYFRLRQVDIDGTEKLYDPINVSCSEVTTGYFSSFPNPSGAAFQVIVNNKELIGACTLNIVDASGKVIEQREIEVKDGINMFVISQELTPGIYFLNVSNGSKSTPVLRHAIK